MLIPPTVVMPLLSKVTTFVINALPKITAVIGTLIEKLPSFIEKIKPVAEIVFELSKQAGKFSDLDNAESLGKRVLDDQDEGVDKNIVKEIATSDKDLNTTKIEQNEENIFVSALILAASALEEEHGESVLDIISLASRNPSFFDANRISAYLDVCKQGELNLPDIVNYFASNLKASDSKMVEDKLFDVEARLQQSSENSSVINIIKMERE